MYRFLMVDDEEIVRRGFESKIDWAGSGFEFLPPCENGRDAMAAIDELLPDVVMTDIHMPHADGITVAAHVLQAHPEIIVVILSGYDDFAYAQAAIRNKVFDYVLKPVTSRDLSALLVKIKGRLDDDSRLRDDETALKERADRSGDLLRERSLAEFLAGAPGSPATRVDAQAVLGFDPGSLACAALVVEGDGASPPPPGELRSRLSQALRTARRSAAFFPSEGRGAALIFEQGLERCLAAADLVASALVEAKPGSDESALRVGVGRAYVDWIDAPRAYEEAAASLTYRLVRESTGPFHYTQASENKEALAELRARADRLCLGVRTGAISRVNELASLYVEALGTARLSPQRARHEVLALFSRVHDELSGIGLGSTALSARLGRDYDRFTESLDRPQAIIAGLARLAEAAAKALESSSLHEPEWKVLDFKEYVARHFSDRQLSVGRVAERLSISESYLSKLLRRKLGASFVDYVSEYRIDRAKELLASSDMMTYEIAEAVGYPDARYFASLFKKRTGMTPSEYRAAPGGAPGSANGGERP